MPLDVLTFQDQGFKFGLGDDKVQVVYVRHQLACLVVALSGGVKVGAHPVAEMDRLADVNHTFVQVAIDIDAGPVGQAIQFVL